LVPEFMLSVAAGLVAGRFIGRFGSRAVLAVGVSVQGLATLPPVFLGCVRVASRTRQPQPPVAGWRRGRLREPALQVAEHKRYG
jgi:hypothetical protein